jgi:glutathione S-transferase
MLEIYGRKNSNQVIQLMWAVGELGLDHVRHNIGGSFGGLDTEEYSAMNPNRLVPTLNDNGFVLWESYAIIRYLCRHYGEGTLWPKDSQQIAVADQWMEWTSSRFIGTFFPIFWSLIRTPKEQQDLRKIAQSAQDTGKLLKIFEAHLQGRNFVTGDQLTMGDIPLGSMMFKYYCLDIKRPALPNIEAWYERLQQRLAYREHAMNPFGRNYKK